jgi:WD40 repeat protein
MRKRSAGSSRGDCVAAVGSAAIAVGYADGIVRRWQSARADEIQPALKQPGKSSAVAVSPDGKWLVAGSANGDMTCWNEPAVAKPALLLSQGIGVTCLAISPVAKQICSGADRTVRLWDLTSGQLVHSIRLEAKVRCAQFSADGKILALGCADGSVRLCDNREGRLLDFQVRHRLRVNAVALSPDGRFVLSGSDDKSGRLWSVADLQQVGSPLLHESMVTAVAFSPDGSRIVTGSADGNGRLWVVAASDGRQLDLSEPGEVRCVAFSHNSKTLLTGGGELGKRGAGCLWDCDTGALLGTPLVHSDVVFQAAFSGDKRTIGTAGNDGNARLADLVTGKPGPVFRHSHPPAYILFAPRGNLVLTYGGDGVAQLWDTATGRPHGQHLTHKAFVNAAAFHPDGSLFCTGTEDGCLHLWRTTDQAPLFSKGEAHAIVRVIFSHDGKTIAVASGKEVHLYDVATGSLHNVSLVHQKNVWAVAFSHDDRLILTAGDEGIAQLWTADTGLRRGSSFLHGLPSPVAVFSPDSLLVLTGSTDGTARLWDVDTGRSIGPALGHRGVVTCAAFSPDGRRFATGSTGNMVRLLDTPVAVAGAGNQVAQWVEMITGLSLDANDGPIVLDARNWEERRLMVDAGR